MCNLSGLGEGDSALNSDKDEDDWPGGNSSGASYSTGTTPSPTDHTKQRRNTATDDPALQNGSRRTGCSIKRKGAIKKRSSMPRTKSAPATPLVMDKINAENAHKNPSTLIQQKIRSLEERACWNSTMSIDGDFMNVNCKFKISIEHTLLSQ